jgi:hypothetical protein
MCFRMSYTVQRLSCLLHYIYIALLESNFFHEYDRVSRPWLDRVMEAVRFGSFSGNGWQPVIFKPLLPSCFISCLRTGSSPKLTRPLSCHKTGTWPRYFPFRRMLLSACAGRLGISCGGPGWIGWQQRTCRSSWPSRRGLTLFFCQAGLPQAGGRGAPSPPHPRLRLRHYISDLGAGLCAEDIPRLSKDVASLLAEVFALPEGAVSNLSDVSSTSPGTLPGAIWGVCPPPPRTLCSPSSPIFIPSTFVAIAFALPAFQAALANRKQWRTSPINCTGVSSAWAFLNFLSGLTTSSSLASLRERPLHRLGGRLRAQTSFRGQGGCRNPPSSAA